MDILNEIKAKVNDIISNQNINLLVFKKDEFFINVLILQLNIDLKINDIATLYIKPTKIFIVKKKCEFENILPVRIKSIKKGKVISLIKCLFLDSEFEVVMLNKSVNFKEDDNAYMLFKSSDVSIRKKID